MTDVSSELRVVLSAGGAGGLAGGGDSDVLGTLVLASCVLTEEDVLSTSGARAEAEEDRAASSRGSEGTLSLGLEWDLGGSASSDDAPAMSAEAAGFMPVWLP